MEWYRYDGLWCWISFIWYRVQCYIYICLSMGWYLMIWFDLVWYGIGIMKYIHTRYCIVCIVSILCRYYSNMLYISLIHRSFIASLFLYFRVFIVFVSYNSYYEVNGPCFRKQHVNLNDHQLNLRYKLLRPKSSCFFIFCHYLGLRKNTN